MQMMPRNRAWTAADDERLKSHIARGGSAGRASVMLRRSEQAVKTRAADLGLRFPTIRELRERAAGITPADLSASPTIEEVMAYIQAHKESDPAPPILKQQNLGSAFSHAAMKALIYIGVSHDEAQSWLRAAEDLASPGPDGVPEMSALIDLHKMEVRAYNRQKAPEDCQTAIYFQLEIRHYFSTPIACGFEAKK